MILTFQRLELVNFRAFPKLDLDLSSYHGLVLVEGNRGTGRSNGAGKSTILNGIVWALFGRLLVKVKNADSVRYRFAPPKSHTIARVTFSLVDDNGESRIVIVERSRTDRGPSLSVSGLGAAGTVAGIQEALEGILGYNFTTFTIAVAFGGLTSAFCRLGDSDRKLILERMCGGDRFSRAHVVAKTMRDAEAAKRDKLLGEKTLVAARLSDARAVRVKLTYETAAAWSASLAENKRLRLAIQPLVRAADKAAEAFAEWSMSVEEERVRLESERQTAQERFDRAQDLVDARLAAKMAAESVKESCRNAVKKIEDDIANVNTDTHADHCPTCGQRWPHKENPAAVKHRVEEMARNLDSLRRDYAASKSKFVEADSLYEQAVDRRDALRVALRSLKTDVSTRKGQDLLIAATTAESDLRAAQAKYHAHCAGLDIESSGRSFIEADANIAKFRDRLASLDESLSAVARRTLALDFWVSGFGKSGLPSYLIDAAVPILNASVSEVAGLLSSDELFVSFNPAAAKGRGDVFAINVDYADGASDYDDASTGERTRVDVAVLFAIRDLVAHQSPVRCSQLFLDEIMDGCDPAFVEGFVKMLRTRYHDTDVFLISHDDSVKSLCDRSIVVRKRGNAATIG